MEEAVMTVQEKKELGEDQALKSAEVEERKGPAECDCGRWNACRGASPPGDAQDPRPAPKSGAATIAPRDEFRE